MAIEQPKSYRLNKVIKELNIGSSTVVGFLRAKGFVIEDNLNSRLNEEMYNLILAEFASDKFKSNAINETYKIIGDVSKILGSKYKQSSIAPQSAEPRTDIKSFPISNFDYINDVKEEEGLKREYKATLTWDVKKGLKNDKMILGVAKTIVAFLNSKGGRLYIGIYENSDTKSNDVIGLDLDYNQGGLKNRDGVLQRLANIVKEHLGTENSTFIETEFIVLEAKDVLVINIKSARSPVFLKWGDKEEFYIRNQSTSEALSIKKATEYIRNHFKTS